MSVSSLIFYEEKNKQKTQNCFVVLFQTEIIYCLAIYVEDHRGVHSRELKMLHQEFEVSGFHNKIITLI